MTEFSRDIPLPVDLQACFETMTLEDQIAYKFDLAYFGRGFMRQEGERYVRVAPEDVYDKAH